MATYTQLAQQYATALSRAAGVRGADTQVLTENLMTHLRARGRLKLLPGIARALQTYALRHAAQAPVVEVARAHDASAALADALALGVAAKKATTNPSLVRGWRARARGVLVDHSAKAALIELYRHITH